MSRPTSCPFPSPSSATKCTTSGTRVPRRAAARSRRGRCGRTGPTPGQLTFDDGYRDALTHVAPILREFGFPATFFIVGEALDPAHEFWWMRSSACSCRPPVAGAVRDRAARQSVDPPAVGREQQLVAHARVVDAFYQLDRAAAQTVLRALEAWSGCGPAPAAGRKTMAADEVIRLAAIPGMSIGAHLSNATCRRCSQGLKRRLRSRRARRGWKGSSGTL